MPVMRLRLSQAAMLLLAFAGESLDSASCVPARLDSDGKTYRLNFENVNPGDES
jgi:hypothetical protein